MQALVHHLECPKRAPSSLPTHAALCAPPTGLAPPLKRKKTVTWAEDDELELPLGPPGGAAEGAAAAAAAPVVVLPCDGLFDALTADLLEQQGKQSAAVVGL